MLNTIGSFAQFSALLIFLNFLVFILGAIFVGGVFFRRNRILEDKNKRLTAMRSLDEVMMSSSTNLLEVAQKVTDAIAFNLGFSIGVLALIDKEKGVLRRVAMSQTPEGRRAMSILPIDYKKIDIPLNYKNNLLVKVLENNQIMVTDNLYDVFAPIFDKELSRKIQGTVRVKIYFVYPVIVRGKAIGSMIFSSEKDLNKISKYDRETMKDVVDVVGIALDNAILYQKLNEKTEQLILTNQEVYKMNEKLHELDKLKDDFVSVASHELRTPMTAIRSYSWMALNRSDVPLSPKMKKYMNRVLSSTQRLINLVNDMLNISRIESGRIEILPKAFVLKDLVDEVAQEIGAKSAEKSQQVHILSSPVPEVFADEDKVHQVLLNLLGNAMKFTPANGTITVSWESDGQMVSVAVKDSGVGISREDISHLFQKFGRLDSSYVASATSGGTGLGLFICKSLVELMKGKIWAESEGVGKGATFKFTLPAATNEVLSHRAFYTNKIDGEAKYLERPAL